MRLRITEIAEVLYWNTLNDLTFFIPTSCLLSVLRLYSYKNSRIVKSSRYINTFLRTITHIILLASLQEFAAT